MPSLAEDKRSSKGRVAAKGVVDRPNGQQMFARTRMWLENMHRSSRRESNRNDLRKKSQHKAHLEKTRKTSLIVRHLNTRLPEDIFNTRIRRPAVKKDGGIYETDTFHGRLESHPKTSDPSRKKKNQRFSQIAGFIRFAANRPKLYN